jgi:hypothetical protein
MSGYAYVATVPWSDDFRLFLVGLLRLFSVTSAWTVRIVFPAREELESPCWPTR